MTAPSEAQTERGWTPDDATFGARLALIRQRMGWGNVKKAADECGLPVETWRTWERDGVVPNRLVTIAMTIATKTGCDYLWLVHGPARGGAMPIGRYGRRPRVVATVAGQAAAGPVSLDTMRPVTQTRPVPAKVARPSRSSDLELAIVGRL